MKFRVKEIPAELAGKYPEIFPGKDYMVYQPQTNKLSAFRFIFSDYYLINYGARFYADFIIAENIKAGSFFYKSFIFKEKENIINFLKKYFYFIGEL